MLALTMTPIFFNLYSARHFEPDKAAVLRSLALIALAAVVVRWLETLIVQGRRLGSAKAAAATGPPLWRRMVELPLVVPVVIYALVYLFATLVSIMPATSFWGSYQRLQGTYTHLSYIALFAAMVATLRRRAQMERVVTVSLVAGATVAGYGILQHLGLDPLPWRGDVIARVASTMGNSIFVAAYMIMILPLALYRIVTALSAAPTAPVAARRRDEWLWALTHGLLFAAGMLLLLAILKFWVAVRTVDFRYWWVYPGAVICATALWWLPTTGYERRNRSHIPLWPGLMLLVYLLVFGVQFAYTTSAGAQALARESMNARAQDWWLWLALAVLLMLGAYGLSFGLPRLTDEPSRLWHRLTAAGAGAAALMLLVAIFFTQSRGPWLGLGAGLFVFGLLLLWQAMRRARTAGDTGQARLFQTLLTGWLVATLIGAVFLLVFNLSQAPFFQQLREIPYVGRMGRLLEIDRGTGLVRRLIWFGDEHAGGVMALILSDPVRMIVGWGPESMFVAFNPFYPPSLANVEARGASPDRSHQALLDELVTRGVLGLASYLFLVFSALALSWRLMRRSDEWGWQVFFAACLSVLVAHFVEGLTGIPIVSTLTMFWVTLAMVVTGGALAGHYRLGLASASADDPAPTAVDGARGGKKRQAAPRGAMRAAVSGSSRSGGRSAEIWLATGLIAVVVLAAIWRWNAAPILADMHFQQGQSLSESAAHDLSVAVQALDKYLQALRTNPREDFYYLHLGRILMAIGDTLRLAGVPLGEVRPEARVEDLLRLRDRAAISGFVQRSSPMEMMSYAEAVLLRAHQLNPRNKDHFANLGRLNSYWYTWNADLNRLHTALQWYERVTPVAPQDVTLLNERAGVMVMIGDYLAANGDAVQARQLYEQATELLRHSERLDPRYADTYVRLGDLERQQYNNPEAAVAAYVKAIERDGAKVATVIERIADSLAGRPDLIGQLRDAYARQAAAQEERLAAVEARRGTEQELATLRQRAALLHSVTGLLAVRAGDVQGSLKPYRRAVELEPMQANYSRNYAIVLSDTHQYAEALAETRRVLSVLEGRPGAEEEIAAARRLMAAIEQAQANHQ